MTKIKTTRIQRWSKPLTTGTVTAIILYFGFMAWSWQTSKNIEATFNNSANIFKDEVSAKVLGYEEAISNIRRLASPTGLSKADWDSYYQAVDLSRSKGLSTVSFSKLVLRSEKATYERQNFRIFPADNKDEYLPVTLITPPNPAYMGFDSGTSSPERYAWITMARDTGQLQRSNAYVFKSSVTEPVTLMFVTVPIYRTGVPVSTVEERRQSYSGTVIGTLRLDQLVPALLSGIASTKNFRDVEIYDTVDESAFVMNDSDSTKKASSYSLSKTIEVTLGNRPLKMVLGTEPNNIGKLPSQKLLLAILPFSLLAVWVVRRKQP